MATEEHNQAPDRLVAKDDDPRLGVHELSEFAFCPRAGLCMHEQDDEPEPRDDDPDTSYLPIYERDELERSLKALLIQFWSVVFGGVVATVASAFVAWLTTIVVLWIATIAIVVVAVAAAVDRGSWAFKAWQYLAIWKEAEGSMPDPDSTKTQDIHWCELLAAGGTLFEPPAPYYHDAWKLGGSPWRVLQYGDLRIPVFRYGRDWEGLFPQHFVRMAAYCHLLEAREGYRSPYGVILQGRTYAATVVPNSPKSKKAFWRALAEVRETIRASEETNAFPPVGGPGNVCRSCRFGEPVRYKRGRIFMRHAGPIPVATARGYDGWEYHTHCGDRFRWSPKHDAVVAQGLVRESPD